MEFTLFQALLAFTMLNIILFVTVFQKSLIKSYYFLQISGDNDDQILYNGLDQLKDEEYYNIPHFEQIVENLYSLSAFYDERSEDLKILGIASLDKFPNISCNYFRDNSSYNYSGLMEVVPGIVRYLLGQPLRNDMFSLVWIECPIEKRSLLEYKTTLEVQVIEDSASDDYYNTTGGGHFIEHSPRDNETLSYKYKMAMCVQPLVNYEEPILLAEWIEFHTLLGVEHFTFYNTSIGPKTSKLLNSYNSRQIKIFQWILPFDQTKKTIVYHGQILQINDCLYRYKGVAKFVGFVDVDEMIVPGVKYWNNFTTYDESFEDIFAKGGPELVAGILVYAKFSFHNFPTRNLTDGLANSLRILTRPNLASSSTFMYKTKAVLRPEFVLEEEVHWPTLLINGTKVVQASEEEVFFIHYRVCDEAYLKAYCTNNSTTCDNILYNDEGSIVGSRFGNVVLQNVKSRLKLSHD